MSSPAVTVTSRPACTWATRAEAMDSEVFSLEEETPSEIVPFT
nr:hypothetical protein [Kiloniella majae]